MIVVADGGGRGRTAEVKALVKIPGRAATAGRRKGGFCCEIFHFF